MPGRMRSQIANEQWLLQTSAPDMWNDTANFKTILFIVSVHHLLRPDIGLARIWAERNTEVAIKPDVPKECEYIDDFESTFGPF